MHTCRRSEWLMYTRKTLCKMAQETAQQAIKTLLICNEITVSDVTERQASCIPIQLCSDARRHLESTLPSPPALLSSPPFQRTRPVLDMYLPSTAGADAHANYLTFHSCAHNSGASPACPTVTIGQVLGLRKPKMRKAKRVFFLKQSQSVRLPTLLITQRAALLHEEMQPPSLGNE